VTCGGFLRQRGGELRRVAERQWAEGGAEGIGLVVWKVGRTWEVVLGGVARVWEAGVKAGVCAQVQHTEVVV
jgi:hypothetical protein